MPAQMARITVQLTHKELASLDEMCERSMRSRSNFIRKLVKRAVNHGRIDGVDGWEDESDSQRDEKELSYDATSEDDNDGLADF